MINALTVDVEDYFHVTAFERCIRHEDWERYPVRVVDNTLRVLDLLDELSLKATFFVLGWVAETQPSLVGEIAGRGHEIGSHGYGHELAYRIGPDRFREDIRKSKEILEAAGGRQVFGYRAPSYSITSESLWALDVLMEEGFVYDSSIFPISHDTYGIPDASRFPHEIRRGAGKIIEFPMSTIEVRILGRRIRIPVAGGGYLRLFPVSFIKKAIARLNQVEGEPAVIYFHPWEIDPGQPRLKPGPRSRFRHYLNLGRMMEKLRKLLGSFDFCPMGEVLGVTRAGNEPTGRVEPLEEGKSKVIDGGEVAGSVGP